MFQYVSGLKIGEKLGSGAFGEVFCGEDPTHGKVAVKILSRRESHNDVTWPAFKVSYLAEARNLAKAEHRNVVRVHHVVETPDGQSVAICMAFCPGGSLQVPYEKGPMTLSDVRKIGTNVLMGLQAIHARGMIHRDIKPANILLNNRNEPQISDFGLVTDEIVLGYASQAGYCDHIAYEVWHGKGTSIKSDIWALGMTLYRLLHGKSWYEEAPPPAAIIPQGGFADSLRWLPHVPKAWRTMLRKMLNDDDAKRYQSDDQVLNALAKLPTPQDWEVCLTSNFVQWSRIQKSRRIVVEWNRPSMQKHQWEAWSEPLDKGRKRHLKGSQGEVSSKEALKGLEKFFS
ncbi:serine/threonine-protein kinase (plasmid) [Tistrella mobilis]|uniref:serine/threonine-protein kinase n=1 Tax=Tistrella mobilis TaxID=171437 RepID=UPI003557B587